MKILMHDDEIVEIEVTASGRFIFVNGNKSSYIVLTPRDAQALIDALTVTLQQMTPPAPPVAGDDGLTA